MRTKTLFLMAAAVAAGAVTSMAQVYSVNAVGYVNKTIPASSFMMLSNPLKAADNHIKALFAGVPDGFQVFYFDTTKSPAKYLVATFDELSSDFVGDTIPELLPGSGVFVKNPSKNPVTVTFVGEVMQGHLVTPLVAGLQIVSSQVPQAGLPTDLGYVGAVGDQIYQYNPTAGKYDVATFDDLSNAFDPAPKAMDVGDAFFLKKTVAGNWTRDFNVNQ